MLTQYFKPQTLLCFQIEIRSRIKLKNEVIIFTFVFPSVKEKFKT